MLISISESLSKGDKMSELQTENRDRTEFGQLFKWNAENREWETTSGRKAIVRPPDTLNMFWYVKVPNTGYNEPLSGEHAEQKAFSLAEMFSRQHD